MMIKESGVRKREGIWRHKPDKAEKWQDGVWTNEAIGEVCAGHEHQETSSPGHIILLALEILNCLPAASVTCLASPQGSTPLDHIETACAKNNDTGPMAFNPRTLPDIYPAHKGEKLLGPFFLGLNVLDELYLIWCTHHFSIVNTVVVV